VTIIVSAAFGNVAPLAIAFRHGRGELRRVSERVGAALLDGGRRAVPHVRPHGVQHVDDIRIADGESEARSRHVEALRQRVKLDRHVRRSGNLEHARRHEPVEGDLAVCEVGDEDDSVPRAESHRLVEELERRDRAGGVVRIVEQEEP